MSSKIERVLELCRLALDDVVAAAAAFCALFKAVPGQPNEQDQVRLAHGRHKSRG